MKDWETIQRQVCEEVGAESWPVDYSLKVGISMNVREGVLPIRGLRNRPESTTSGWYIWAGGRMSQDDDFFVPLHASHLADWCPLAIKYLQLPPGWHFLTDGSYEDIWFDEGTRDWSP